MARCACASNDCLALASQEKKKARGGCGGGSSTGADISLMSSSDEEAEANYPLSPEEVKQWAEMTLKLAESSDAAYPNLQASWPEGLKPEPLPAFLRSLADQFQDN